jgi:hypothetical protein
MVLSDILHRKSELIVVYPEGTIFMVFSISSGEWWGSTKFLKCIFLVLIDLNFK